MNLTRIQKIQPTSGNENLKMHNFSFFYSSFVVQYHNLLKCMSIPYPEMYKMMD